MTWEAALRTGDTEFFSKLMEEVDELNQFGDLIKHASFGTKLLEDAFAGDIATPLRAAKLVGNPVFDYFVQPFYTLADAVMPKHEDVPEQVRSLTAEEASSVSDNFGYKQGSDMTNSVNYGRWISKPQLLVFLQEAESLTGVKGVSMTALNFAEIEVPAKYHAETFGEAFDSQAVAGSGVNAVQGLFQMKRVAWQEAASIPMVKGGTLASVIGDYDKNVLNPRLNAIAAVGFLIKNRQYALKVPGVRDLMAQHNINLSSASTAYVLHNRGIGNFKKLLQAGPDAIPTLMARESPKARAAAEEMFGV